MVPIKRPQPNDLVVRATVNGRDVSLILDTGWGADGISLNSGYLRSLHLQAEALNGRAETATGRKIVMTKGTAETVVLGNVQIKGVPLFFGTFDALSDRRVRQRIGADGFVGAGSLRINSAILIRNLRLLSSTAWNGRLSSRTGSSRGFPETLAGPHHGQPLADAEINGRAGGKKNRDRHLT